MRLQASPHRELAFHEHGADLDAQSMNFDLETIATQAGAHGDQTLGADVIYRS